MARNVAPMPDDPSPRVVNERAPKKKKKRKKKKQNPVATIISVLFVLVGIAVMVYPVVATQINNIRQGEMAALHREEIAAAKRSDPKVLEEGLAAAHEYNANAPSVPVSDPWSAQDHTADNPEYAAYLEQLNDFSTMGTVTIPTINSSMPIYHGTAPATLDKGVGHLYGTSLPVGGKGTHSVLTAHTGLRQATAWDNLIDVTEGDEIFVEVYGETMKYRVYATNVVLPTDTDALMFNDRSRELLTLITCTPYGVNSHRLLVHAERVELTAADREMLEETSNFVMQWWMWLVIAVVALLLVWVIWRVVRAMREAKN